MSEVYDVTKSLGSLSEVKEYNPNYSPEDLRNIGKGNKGKPRLFKTNGVMSLFDITVSNCR